MPETEGVQTGRRRPTWEWKIGAVAVICLLLSSPLGHWLPRALQSVAQSVVLYLPFFLITLAWVRFALARKEGRDSRWRLWVSLCGCIALSLALAIPLVVMFIMLDWSRLAMWCFGFGLLALLAGCLGARSARFPLIFGGLVMAGLVVIIPMGIL